MFAQRNIPSHKAWRGDKDVFYSFFTAPTNAVGRRMSAIWSAKPSPKWTSLQICTVRLTHRIPCSLASSATHTSCFAGIFPPQQTETLLNLMQRRPEIIIFVKSSLISPFSLCFIAISFVSPSSAPPPSSLSSSPRRCF